MLRRAPGHTKSLYILYIITHFRQNAEFFFRLFLILYHNSIKHNILEI